MRNSAAIRLLASVAAALSVHGEIRAQPPEKSLTQDELLREIEALKPSPGAIVRRNPAIAQNSPRASVGAPEVASSVQPLFADGREKAAKGAKTEGKAKGATEIVALEATFDQKAHLAVFTGEVVVTDPAFIVQADKLTAYLKHEEKPAPEVAPTRLVVPNSKPEPKSASKGGGLEKAIAEADPGKNVTVIQEKEEADGSMSRSIGHGKKVIYDASTGDITLTGRPDVQQGINTCVATDESTIMILNRDGHMKVTGPHKTVIKESDLNK